jgi:putative transposase
VRLVYIGLCLAVAGRHWLGSQVSKSERPGAPVAARIFFRFGDFLFCIDSVCSFVTSLRTVCIYSRHVSRLLKRCYGAGDLHFITCSCYKRRPVLGTASRRDLFLTVLERVRRRYRLVVIGYVVMPEHFHLLITEPQIGDPSVVMQALKLGFARRMLAEMARSQASKSERPGTPTPNHVWSARFYDFNVYSERKRIEKLRYIHRNPVERGLVTESDQWQWSSFRSYLYGEVGPVRVNDWQLLELRATGLAASASPTLTVVPSRVSKTARPGAPVLGEQKLFGS